MYVVVQHQIRDPQTAFARGVQLMQNEGAPAGVEVLQFLPSRDGSAVVCVFDAPTVEAVQAYVDGVLGDSSENACYEVDAEQAFSQRPSSIRESAAVDA